VIHLRVVSPPDVTGTLMPMFRSEPAVLNLTVLPGAVSHPDGDAVHFDVLHGAAEVESRIALEGTFPPSWFTLLIIAGLIGTVGILTNSQILIVGAMVVGPEYGAILSLAFGVTRRDSSRVRPVSSLIDTPNWFSFIVALLAGVFISVTTIPAASDIGVSLAFGSGSEAWGSVLQLLLNVTVLTAVAIAGLPAQRAIWRRTARRAAAAPPDSQKTGG
jgi:hypothetical protein